MMITRKALTFAATAATLAGSAAVLAAPAQAAGRNGSCESGEFCYYYNSGNAGSVSDFTGSLGDYGTTQPSCYDFKGAGNGKGVCVKNNAASVWNRTIKTVTVYFNSNYGGTSQSIASGAKANLSSALKNNNASHRIGGSSGGGTGSPSAPRNDYDGNARGFAQNNCTAFAAYRVASRTSRKGFQNNYRGVQFGNANTWDDAARKLGITVDKSPAAGAIAVNEIHKTYGHVAYINKVYSDGSFDVEEYNWNVSLGYGTRKHMRVSNVDPNFQWIIHF